MKDIRRLIEHLCLGYPHRSLGDGHGEVVDLDSVELLYRHPDYAVQVEQHFAGFQSLADDNRLVLELAQGKESLGEEVSASAGGVEER